MTCVEPLVTLRAAALLAAPGVGPQTPGNGTTGSYGSGLAKFLRRHGRKVIECSRPPRAGERRGNGKLLRLRLEAESGVGS